MIGIDRNVLVRILVDDAKAMEQCQIARDFVTQQDKVFISTTVLVETIWVLQHVYAVEKQQLLDILNQLLLQKQLRFEHRLLIEKAVDFFQTETFRFSDALILASNKAKDCHLYTFDKRLGRHANVSYIAG